MKMPVCCNESEPRLCLSRPLAVAAHNLHLVRMDGRLVVELEVYVLDQKSPDLVAEAVCVKVTLIVETKREFKRQR